MNYSLYGPTWYHEVIEEETKEEFESHSEKSELEKIQEEMEGFRGQKNCVGKPSRFQYFWRGPIVITAPGWEPKASVYRKDWKACH